MRKFNNYDLTGEKPVLAWNPLAMRCSPAGEGCRNCWHLKAADRLAKNPTLTQIKREAYAGLLSCAQPLAPYARIPKNRVVAVQFMGDLWHETVPQFQRDLIFTRCVNYATTKFLFLTKRPQNVREQIPPNCWIGVSAWNQASLCDAFKAVEKINAPRRLWMSLEPLIGEITELPILPPGLGFLAVGPERVNRKERDSYLTYKFLDRYEHILKTSGVAVYDKREDWCIREWPEAWKMKVPLKGR